MEEKMEESWTWDGVRAITITQTGAGLSGRFGDCQINFLMVPHLLVPKPPQQKQWKVWQKKLVSLKGALKKCESLIGVFGLSCCCFWR